MYYNLFGLSYFQEIILPSSLSLAEVEKKKRQSSLNQEHKPRSFKK